MALAAIIKEYLENLKLSYELVAHSHSSSALRSAEAAHVPGDLIAKSVLLGDDTSYVLAVIPASHRLELERLNTLTGRTLELVHEDEIEAAFADCERGAIPAVGEAYGIDTIVDNALFSLRQVYFEAGDHEHLVRVAAEDFRKVMGGAQHARISHHL